MFDNIQQLLTQIEYEALITDFAWPKAMERLSQIVPSVFCPRAGGRYTMPKGDEYFNIFLQPHVRGADIQQFHVDGTTGSLTTEIYLLGKTVFEDDRQEYVAQRKDPRLIDTMTIANLNKRIVTGEYVGVLAPLATAGNFTNAAKPGTTANYGPSWADTTSTPLSDMLLMTTTLADYQMPNTIVIGEKAVLQIARSDEYKEYTKYTTISGLSEVAAVIAQVTNVPPDRVFVVGGRFFADIGIAAADIFGYNCLLCYVDPGLIGNFNLIGTDPIYAFAVNAKRTQTPLPKPVEPIWGKGGGTLYSVETSFANNLINELLGGIIHDTNG